MSLTRELNQEAAEELYNLSDLDVGQNFDPDCGTFAFKLVDDAHADILSVTSDGFVTLLPVVSESLVGSHEVKFAVYLDELDPNAVFSWPLDFV